MKKLNTDSYIFHIAVLQNFGEKKNNFKYLSR